MASEQSLRRLSVLVVKEKRILLYNNRGISVHAFGFSWAGSLSARRVGWLGATLRQVLTRVRTGGWRCHSDVTILRDKTGDGVRVTSRTESARRFVWEFEERESWILDAKREGSTFGALRREANLRPIGAARVGGQRNKTAWKIVFLLLMSKPLSQS